MLMCYYSFVIFVVMFFRRHCNNNELQSTNSLVHTNPAYDELDQPIVHVSWSSFEVESLILHYCELIVPECSTTMLVTCSANVHVQLDHILF